jgi:hypothetical protein
MKKLFLVFVVASALTSPGLLAQDARAVVASAAEGDGR